MRKKVLASFFTLFALVVFIQSTTAEMAKEGTGSSTTMYSGSYNVVSLDDNHLVIHYQNKGALVSDSGKGPFNNMSIYNVGTIYFENGVGKLTGYITLTDPEGDKVLAEIKEDNAKPAPAMNSGSGKFVYGTGKYAGITGTMEYKRRYVRPATKDTFQAIAKTKSSWKIP